LANRVKTAVKPIAVPTEAPPKETIKMSIFEDADEEDYIETLPN
jgi:hypothetical protein